MKSFNSIINKLTDRMMGKYEKAMERASAFNQNNYPKKAQLLKEKLTDEYKLWSLKKAKYPNRFHDVDRDVNTLKSIMLKEELSAADKSTVDRLCYKYSVTP